MLGYLIRRKFDPVETHQNEDNMKSLYNLVTII